MSAPPAAVLFDMDGTLVDTEPLWMQTETAVMAVLGGNWTPEDQAHCLGLPLAVSAAYLLERSPSTLTVDEVCTLMMDDVDVRMRTTALSWRPGAKDLLRECRESGIPTALVSASWARLIRTMRDHMEADLGGAAFDVVIAGDEVANGKPHPEPYRRAAQALGVTPDRCLAVEDSPAGVQSAVRAGCRVVAVPHIADIDEAGAHVVSTLAGWSVRDLWELTRA